jgi:hypothetical protein
LRFDGAGCDQDARMSAGEAQFLLDSKTVKEIFAQLERDAIETAIGAKLGDDECRRNALGEVRAIRSLKWKLEALVRAKTTPVSRAVV